MIDENKLIALIDCMYKCNRDQKVRETIDSIIDVVYDLAEMEGENEVLLGI